MKVFSIIIFLSFLALAGFYFLGSNKPQSSIISDSKAIGEKPSRDLAPMPPNLQRMRIDAKADIKFKATSTSEAYELDEHELDDFKRQVKNLKGVNQFGQEEFLPNGEVNTDERDYYEADD